MTSTYVYDGNVWVDSGAGVQGTIRDDVGDQITHVELTHSTALPQQLLHLQSSTNAQIICSPGVVVHKYSNHALIDLISVIKSGS